MRVKRWTLSLFVPVDLDYWTGLGTALYDLYGLLLGLLLFSFFLWVIRTTLYCDSMIISFKFVQ